MITEAEQTFAGMTTSEVRDMAMHARYDFLASTVREAARLEVQRREKLKINYVPYPPGDTRRD